MSLQEQLYRSEIPEQRVPLRDDMIGEFVTRPFLRKNAAQKDIS